MRDKFHTLVEAAEFNPLLREVDALCERRDWAGLGLLRQMCLEAVERGKQLWPIAEHTNFRLVLEGPPEVAGPMVVPNTGRFAPGPLTEVAASTHTFTEIAHHLPSALARESVAAERVVRGEDLSADPRAHPQVVEVPLHLLASEPAYRLATYRKDHVEVQEPLVPSLSAVSRPAPGKVIDDERLTEALLDLVRPWFEESGGEAEALVVDGNPMNAIGSLQIGEVATAELTFTGALELMAWAAAGGGIHGRRRGAAYGRFSAWWATAQMCDLPWPPNSASLEAEGADLEWITFRRSGERASGWHLGLACGSEEEGWACALYARDVPAQDDGAG